MKDTSIFKGKDPLPDYFKKAHSTGGDRLYFSQYSFFVEKRCKPRGLVVESGMTPYEALSAGTRNAGQVVAHMGRDGNFGVIRVGNRADLVLLSKNPFESVSATRDRIGVMARGRWYLQQELNGMVDRWVETLEEK